MPVTCYSPHQLLQGATELIVDDDVLYSSGMPMYVLSTVSLIKKLHCHLGDVSQVCMVCR